MKNKQTTPSMGAHSAGASPVHHPKAILARQHRVMSPEEEKSLKSINEDDIEADRHNGSGGAFEATEREQDDE